MGFIYLNKFTYLNTSVIQVAQRCSDNGGPTVIVIMSSIIEILEILLSHSPTKNEYDSVFSFPSSEMRTICLNVFDTYYDKAQVDLSISSKAARWR